MNLPISSKRHSAKQTRPSRTAASTDHPAPPRTAACTSSTTCSMLTSWVSRCRTACMRRGRMRRVGMGVSGRRRICAGGSMGGCRMWCWWILWRWGRLWRHRRRLIGGDSLSWFRIHVGYSICDASIYRESISYIPHKGKIQCHEFQNPIKIAKEPHSSISNCISRSRKSPLVSTAITKTKEKNEPQILFADATITSALESNFAEYRSASVGCN